MGGVKRMRNSTGMANTATGRARAARSSSPFSRIGVVAVTGLVLACASAVYGNVFSSGAYPSVGGFEDRFSAAPVPSTNLSAASHVVAKTQGRPQVALASLAPATASMQDITAVAPAEPAQEPSRAGLSREEFAARFAPRSVSVAPAPVAEAAPQVAAAPQPAARQQVAALVPLPSARPSEASAQVAARGSDKGPSLREIAQANRQASIAANNAPSKAASIFEKLFGKSEPLGAVLAFASPDGGVMSDGRDAPQNTGRYDRFTAVYDISARKVYLPDGTQLEAHSGLGPRMDDPRYVHERMRGATPPHLYDLSMREALFHGVEAIRLNPVGGAGAIHGRTGLLAHTYMLGPRGDSNGCVSFKDYQAFLRAFKNQQIKRLAVVASLD